MGVNGLSEEKQNTSDDKYFYYEKTYKLLIVWYCHVVEEQRINYRKCKTHFALIVFFYPILSLSSKPTPKREAQTKITCNYAKIFYLSVLRCLTFKIIEE